MEDEDISWPGAWSPAKPVRFGTGEVKGEDEVISRSSDLAAHETAAHVGSDQDAREASGTPSVSDYQDFSQDGSSIVEEGRTGSSTSAHSTADGKKGGEDDLLTDVLEKMSINSHEDKDKTVEAGMISTPRREKGPFQENVSSTLGTPTAQVRGNSSSFDSEALRTPVSQILAPSRPSQPVEVPSSSPLHAVAVFVQGACHGHKYIRNKHVAGIVERPERLRAVYTGCAAAKLKMEMEGKPGVDIHHSARISNLSDPIVTKVHGTEWPSQLRNLCEKSVSAIENGGSEIPPSLSQGDLYLCPTSLQAIEGSLGTIAEAIDALVKGTYGRIFAAIRPPGHHCGQANPMGFCFVNNAIYGAEYAHQVHNINRTVIFDIDLHHGNGTQALALRLNDETWQRGPDGSEDRKIFYGSLHDIRSYPCELGDVDLVKDASMQVMAHGQAIINVHLDHYANEDDFEEIYRTEYSLLFKRARQFLRETHAKPERTLVIISAGFDASEHEYSTMQRHGYKVPTSFYRRFTKDAVDFAQDVSSGRLLSLLEGGYSDRALISGSMGHLLGLVEFEEGLKDTPSWLSEETLSTLEKIAKRKKSRSGVGKDQWLNQVGEVVDRMDGGPHSSSTTDTPSILASAMGKMTLRDRKKGLVNMGYNNVRSTESTPSKTATAKRRAKSSQYSTPVGNSRYQPSPTDAPMPPLPPSFAQVMPKTALDELDPSHIPLPESPKLSS